MPFENRSGVVGLEWMRLAVPFVLGERLEGFVKLRPVYSTFVVEALPKDSERVDATAVAAFAKQSGARWVFTGWVQRPNWKLELGVTLYKIAAGKAVRIHEVVKQGEFKDVHVLLTSAIAELGKSAGLDSQRDNAALLARESTQDFYAFTLFGRALWATLAAKSAKDWERARKTMERTAYIDPAFLEAQRMVAALYHKDGRDVIATGRLELVLKDRPDYAAAVASLARSTLAKGQTLAARELFERLLQLRPWDLEARYDYGEVLWEQGRDDDAFAQFSMVTKQRPNHIRARRALVLIHAKRIDTSSLVTELQAISKLAPTDIPTRLDLAAALVAADRIDEAIEAYKGIEQLDARNVQALKFLGDLYRNRGQVQRAIRYYGLAIKAAPGDPRAYFLLGSTYLGAGNDDAARRIFLKAQRFAHFRAESYNNLGAIELRRDRVHQSLWYLRRAVKLKPQIARYHYNLALSLSRTRQSDEALSEINEALRLQADNAESHYLRGVVLLRKGAAETAREAFKRTLALEPGHKDAAHNLALLNEMRRKATEGEVVTEGK